MVNKSITFAGKTYRSDSDGDYIIPRKELQGQDLRALPPDTKIAGSHVRKHGIDSSTIFFIHATGSSGFEVEFDYWQCLKCWEHALAYSKYMDAARDILIQAATVGIIFHNSLSEVGGVHHICHMVRSEYSIEAMEAGLEADVNNALSALKQFRTQVDQQFEQQFNV